METTKQMPEWATVDATVYAREKGPGRGEATLRKGTITRVTASSIFVRLNLAAGTAAGESRYTLQRWNDDPQLHGNPSDYYHRSLVSEARGLRELEQIAARRTADQVRQAAVRAAEGAAHRLSPITAREAIDALQAYLEQTGE